MILKDVALKLLAKGIADKERVIIRGAKAFQVIYRWDKTCFDCYREPDLD